MRKAKAFVGGLVKPQCELCIEIGEIPILVHTNSAEFASLLHDRYGEFVVGRRVTGAPTVEAPGCGEHQRMCLREDSAGGAPSVARRVATSNFPVPSFELDVELLPPGVMSDAEEARVRLEGGRWVMERGDFRAECDPVKRRGWVRQSANPYSIDAVLRMLHSLILAREGGFLVHAASAVRNGRAFLFAGASGAGKTTISRLAPPDVVLLTDEISYVRGITPEEPGVRSQNQEAKVGKRELVGVQSSVSESRQDSSVEFQVSNFDLGNRQATDHRPSYVAFGTPFAGELARIGRNLRAPIAALCLLGHGQENNIEGVSQTEAARALLQNILFFAHDDELVRLVFQSALEFVSCVPVRRLVFTPDARVWDLIR